MYCAWPQSQLTPVRTLSLSTLSHIRRASVRWCLPTFETLIQASDRYPASCSCFDHGTRGRTTAGQGEKSEGQMAKAEIRKIGIRKREIFRTGSGRPTFFRL